MSTETILITVREDGSRVVTRNFNQMAQAGDRNTQMLSRLKAAVGAVVTGVVIRQLQQFLDIHTKIQNQLRLTTTDQGNLNAVFNELVEVSRRTRSSLETNANLFSRIALSTKDLGTSQQEVIQFTESLNQAVKISGATAVEAEAAIIQLTQGLAAGALRGDELRSVLEQLPKVADVIAKGLGVTRGELRKMGEQGKITAKDVLRAFREAREELDGQFKQTLPTIGEGFIALKNQILVSLGAIDEATGASGFLASSFITISEQLRQLTPEIISFIRALMGTLDPMDEMSDSGKTIATIFITIFGVLKAVAGLLMGAVLIAFKTVGKVIGGVVAAIQQVLEGDFSGAFETVKQAGSDIATVFVEESDKAANSAIDATSSMFEKLNQVWDAGARQIQERKKEIGEVSSATGTARASPINQEELKRVTNSLNRLMAQIDPIGDGINDLAAAQMTLVQAQKLGIITTDQEVTLLIRLQEHYRDILDPLGKLNRELDEQAKLLGLTTREREIETQVLQATKALLAEGVKLTNDEVTALRAKFVALQQLNELTAAQDELLSNSVDARREFITQLEAIKTLLGDAASGFGQGDATRAVLDIIPPDLLEGTQDVINAELEMIRFRNEQIEMLRRDNLISEEAYQTALMRLNAQRFEAEMRTTQQFFGGIAGLMNSGNKKLFKIGQAAAIANAAIQGTQQIMNAAATPPWYVGVALAAVAAVNVAKQISDIRNAKPPGFMSGGYTGDLPTSKVAGAVHGQEFVMNAAATSRIGVRNLEALQTGSAGVSMRGSGGKGTAGSGGGINVQIQNYGTSKEFEVQQVTPEDVRIIARDEAKRTVANETPSLVATQMSDPNSRISKAVSKNTDSQRRR